MPHSPQTQGTATPQKRITRWGFIPVEDERAVVGASILTAHGHRANRQHIAPHHFGSRKHAQLYIACDQLDDIGDAWLADLDTTDNVHVPLSDRVRIAAVYTLVDDAPLWAIQRICEQAPFNARHHHQALLDSAAHRARIETARRQLAELEGTGT